MTRLEAVCELSEYARDNEMYYQELLFMYHDYTNKQLVDEWFDRYGEIIEID